MTTFYDFSVRASDGTQKPLESYRDQVVLIVNVASKCGFTPQYEGLESLHAELSGQGLRILAFPCDQFGHQEPGTDAEIQQFCTSKYQVTFPVLSKVEVNGSAADPLFAWLKQSCKGLLGTEGIKWNFTKFLVDRRGQCVHRYSPKTKPEQLRDDIVSLLG